MPASTTDDEHRYASLQRRVRLTVILDAAERAGLAPLKLTWLHAFAYLCNVLSPVWNMPSFDGKILKRRGGPFYPELQRDLDCLVGQGVATISNLGHYKDQDESWRLEGSYSLRRAFADKILKQLDSYRDEVRISSFIRELAFALASLDQTALDQAVAEDATYSDPSVSIGNIVDFDEWRKENYSANVAKYFAKVTPSGDSTTPAEKIHLYVRHLYRRASVHP